MSRFSMAGPAQESRHKGEAHPLLRAAFSVSSSEDTLYLAAEVAWAVTRIYRLKTSRPCLSPSLKLHGFRRAVFGDEPANTLWLTIYTRVRCKQLYVDLPPLQPR